MTGYSIVEGLSETSPQPLCACDASGAPWIDAGGREAAVEVLPDARVQARLEAEVERRVARRTAALSDAMRRSAEENRRLRRFVDLVAHDLRQPLRAIAAFVEILEEDHGAGLGAAERGYLDRIRRAGARASRTVASFVDLARHGARPALRERVDVSALAEEVVAELRAGSPGRVVDVAIDEGMGAAADNGLVRMVLQNLLANAWKFTAGVDAARVEVGCAVAEDGSTEFFVRDNGPGVAPEDSERMFEPFLRLAAAAGVDGNGIGLATVRSAIERHGGRVRAEGAPGRGLTVRFSLEAAPTAAA